jgi:phage tail sheath gpL-like
MSISTAVGAERISRIVGYKLRKGNFLESSPNLPQRIFVLGQGNVANQATMPVEKRVITSAKEAGELYGFGSPIYQMMRILRPVSGDGVGGIPTVVFPQEDAVGATQAVIPFDVTIATTATDSATHYAVINGRKELDGKPFAFSVVKGDTDIIVIGKIVAAINNVLGAPVIAATVGDPVTSGTLTSKWAGATAADISLSFDTGDKSCGITYTVSATTGGAGVVDLTDALAAFGNEWNTIVINPYGTATFDALEAFNGIPDPDAPTGRYSAIVFKPFISIWGSTEDDKDDLVTITGASARKTQVTHALAPAPLSKGMQWEAAANMTYLFALMAQNSPHLDVNSKAYPDMPVPTDELIGDMADYTNRDYLVQNGCSTVDLIAGKYTVQDFVTTYHPDGEIPPQFRYCRNLMLDFNVRYGYYLLEQAFVVDKAIAPSDQSINVSGVIKPKDWKQVIRSYADDLALRALVSDADFMKNSIQVAVSTVNPDRLDTFFRYKRTGVARISSTDAEVGFAFGVV